MCLVWSGTCPQVPGHSPLPSHPGSILYAHGVNKAPVLCDVLFIKGGSVERGEGRGLIGGTHAQDLLDLFETKHPQSFPVCFTGALIDPEATDFLWLKLSKVR